MNRSKLYSAYLLDNVIPFWLLHSLDQEFGGYYTCLERDGRIYDTDKFVWLQGRGVWTYAMMYNQVEKKQEWLDAALLGADFLLKHGRDKVGNWYFSLTREGVPLQYAYNIFSDCFAAMAFAQLYKATTNEEYAVVAKMTFDNILRRKDNPKGQYSKTIPGARDLKGFSLPMILCNLVLEIEHLLDSDLVEQTLREGVDEVMNTFYKVELGIILENVSLDGSIVDSHEGRLINPGHGLEAMWFVMDIATRWKDKSLIDKCVEISLQLLSYGWDEEFGGIYYFRDLKGSPLLQLEWDQKLWWVHVEALVTCLKGYELTGNSQLKQWYEVLHNYVWDHFVDHEYGEMFGYLDRRGDPLFTLKGGKWKGCFHVPRALYQLWVTSVRIEERGAVLSN
jgi:N-acylglucosamine 2-epimerase